MYDRRYANNMREDLDRARPYTAAKEGAYQEFTAGAPKEEAALRKLMEDLMTMVR
jgi:hypothetical protein